MTVRDVDPTAGESATRRRAHPGEPQPIFDPTDPRCAKLETEPPRRASEPGETGSTRPTAGDHAA